MRKEILKSIFRPINFFLVMFIILCALILISCEKPEIPVRQQDCFCSPDIKQIEPICKQFCGIIQNFK